MGANAAELDTTVSTRITREGRQYRVRYWVTTTDASDQGIQTLFASGIPARTDYYTAGNSWDMGAFVTDYDASLIDVDGSRKHWAVLVTYSSQSTQSDPEKPPNREGYDYPWDEPTELNGNARVTEERMTSHYPNPANPESETIKNSFGDPRNDEYREYSHSTLTLRKKYHVNSWSPATVRPYTNTVNTEEFFGEYPNYYRCEPPRYSLKFTGGGIAYWDVEYNFDGNAGGWNGQRKVDEGQRYMDHSDGDDVKRFSDDKGLPIGGLGRLDGTGDKLEKWADPVYFPEDGINKYIEKDFGDLPIPTSVKEILQGL